MGGEEKGKKSEMGWWKEVKMGGKGVMLVGEGGLCGCGVE